MSIYGQSTTTGAVSSTASYTAIQSIDTTVNDAILELGTGSNVDSGLILNQTNNKAIIWDNSESEFALCTTVNNALNSTITPSAYQGLHIGALKASSLASALDGNSQSITNINIDSGTVDAITSLTMSGNNSCVLNSGTNNTPLILRNNNETAGFELAMDADNILKLNLSGTGTIIQFEDDRVDSSKNIRVGSTFANNNHQLYLHNSTSTNATMRLDTERYGAYFDMANDTGATGYSFRAQYPNSGQTTLYNTGAIEIKASTSGYGYTVDMASSGGGGYAFQMTNATKSFKINEDNSIVCGAFDIDYSGNRFNITNSSSDRVSIENEATSETPSLQLNSASRTSGRAFGLAVVSHTTSGYDNSGSYHIKCYSGSATFEVAPNGNTKNTNNSYGALSDSKLKHTITDSADQLDKLMNVRIVDYYLNQDLDAYQTKKKGVIAQELEVHYPALVENNADLDKDDNDLGTTTKSVKYSVFVPILIKALQEANQKIIDLTARVDALENP